MQVVSKNHFIMRPGLAGAGGGDGCELELETNAIRSFG